ncbi:MAG: heparan-alpha-glucosaminide N-acetyltransferase domain-containing protein [Myxococcales bacterium]|nr:DUF1624 domain-containing protein [Myxococcales bacterium]
MTRQRVRAFDWLRGLAVLVMIQTHSLALLKPELRAGDFFARLQWLDGLVAPSFIFAAGFAMALTQVRAAAGGGSRSRRIKRTLRRLAEVLAVATLVNWAWFPIFREPRWLIRIDILHCIGLSLLIALPILALLAPHPRALRWSSLALAATAFGLSPLTEPIKAPLGHFLNVNTGSVFPLLPWGGYVYLGAAVGASKTTREMVMTLVGLAVAGVVIWIFTAQVAALYPPHNFWVTDPANHARRWTQVCVLSIGLLAVERTWKTIPVWFIEVFGTSSLAGYFFHEMLLFFRIRGTCFEAVWGNRLSWARYWPVLALLVAFTFALTWLTDQVYRRADAAISTPVPSTAG